MEGQKNDGYWFETRVDQNGENAFSFLSRRFPYRDWKERFAAGKVLVKDRTNPKVMKTLNGSEMLCVEDVIRSFRDPWIEPPVDVTLEIVAESDSLVVVNKRLAFTLLV
jgi:hypothetical protein